jgi:hypothetical protein
MAGKQRPEFVDRGGREIEYVVNAWPGGARHRGGYMISLAQHVHHMGADETASTHYKNSHAESSTPDPTACQAPIWRSTGGPPAEALFVHPETGRSRPADGNWR